MSPVAEREQATNSDVKPEDKLESSKQRRERENVERKERRAQEQKDRQEEMLRRFEADLEELECVWIVEEVYRNGQLAGLTIGFQAK